MKLKKNILSIILSIFVIISLFIKNDYNDVFAGLGILALYIIFFIVNNNIRIPYTINIFYHIHIFLSLELGSVYDFYQMIKFWDLFVHGLFGIEGMIIALFIIIKSNLYDKMNGFIIMLFAGSFSIALGGIWECLEYAFDRIFDSDVQHAFEANAHPLTDTIGDIFITIVGVMICYIIYIVDYLINKKRIMNKILYDFTTKEKALD